MDDFPACEGGDPVQPGPPPSQARGEPPDNHLYPQGVLFWDDHPDGQWIEMGATQAGYSESWSIAWGAAGEAHLEVDLTEYRGGRSSTTTFAMGELTAESLVAAFTGDALWTIGDAWAFLKPQPPRRTLARWLAQQPPIGLRPLKQGGPPARTYLASTIMKRHAKWAKSYGRDLPDDPS